MVSIIRVILVMTVMAACAAGGRGQAGPSAGAGLRPPPPYMSTADDVADLVNQLSAGELHRLLEFAAAAEPERDSPAEVQVDSSLSWNRPPHWDDEYMNEVKPPQPGPDDELTYWSSAQEYGSAELEPEGAYTHTAAAVAVAGGRGLGALPLMLHRNSKPHSGSSYSVPHYTVTGDRSGAEGAGAVCVWVWASRGAAYTLHEDGSLSLERPPAPYPTHPRTHRSQVPIH